MDQINGRSIWIINLEKAVYSPGFSSRTNNALKNNALAAGKHLLSFAVYSPGQHRAEPASQFLGVKRIGQVNPPLSQ